jgi:hypothetical protein
MLENGEPILAGGDESSNAKTPNCPTANFFLALALRTDTDN